MLTEATLHRLEQKQEELALLFLDQTSTEEWKDLSTSTLRGDVYWYKKNAAQTMGLVVRIQSLLNLHLTRPADISPPPPPEDEMRRLTEKAEQDAAEMIERVRGRQTAKR